MKWSWYLQHFCSTDYNKMFLSLEINKTISSRGQQRNALMGVTMTIFKIAYCWDEIIQDFCIQKYTKYFSFKSYVASKIQDFFPLIIPYYVTDYHFEDTNSC